ncbi:MAG: histone deacetylase family protein [Alphaproteobacteria bacterium]|nr:histone deacetylase family protein [Alphaproteobacteria bacterium]
MTTLLFTHPACFDHDPGRMHPEHPARLKAVLSALDAPEFAALVRREAPRAEIGQIARVHPENFVTAALDAMPSEGQVGFDADTIVSPGSREAVLRAAGAVCAAVDAVMASEGANAFCAVRPPGHHAEPTRAMGFCIFNSIAIGALQARAAHGLRRIAVVDFDVHHGNGTQAMFEADGELFYASTHQWPLYPGTGARSERGVGNIVNAPLAPMSGSAEFRAAMTGTVLPALRRFNPEFLLISAGFDAHADDPLASLRLGDDDYEWVTAELAKVAAECCGGRLVSALEGGYDLDALGRASAAHVRALMAA